MLRRIMRWVFGPTGRTESWFVEIRETSPETSPTGDDVRKIHQEVLQIVNQRFLLTSAALVFFATVAGWVTAAVMKEQSGDVRYLPLVAAVLVLVVLYALFAYQASLTVTLRWLTTYLVVLGSEWERDWCECRRRMFDPVESRRIEALVGEEMPFRAYSANPRVFLLLAGMSFTYFSVLHALLWKAEVRDFWITRQLAALTAAAPPIVQAVPASVGWWTMALLLVVVLARRMSRVMHHCETLNERGMHAVWTQVREATRASDAGSRKEAATLAPGPAPATVGTDGAAERTVPLQPTVER